MGRGDGALSVPTWLRVSWVIPAVFLVAFLLVPLVNVAAHTVSAQSFDVLMTASTWTLIGLSTLQALASTALALLVGVPIALVLARYDFAGRGFAKALVTVPFVLPTVVVALAFRTITGEQGFTLVVLAHAYINMAVVVRIVGAQAEQLDPRTALVARTLGATKARAFLDVTLPMLRSAIVSAASVVFIFCFTSLGIVLLIGDASTRTLESQILRRTSVLLDFPGAAALALLQVILVAAVLAIGAVFSRRNYAQRDQTLAKRPRTTLLARCIIAFVYVFTLVPIVALVVASWGWWGSLGSVDAGTNRIGSPISAIGISLLYAIICGVVAAIIGGLAAIAMLAHRAGRFLALLAILPLGISSATLGLGMLLTFSHEPVDLRGTGMLIPLAHSLVAIPLVVAVVAPTLRSADARLVAVAATLGARPTRAFFAAYGSTLRVVMLASAGLACAISLGEFGAASFLTRATSPTVPIQIARLLTRPGDASIGVAAALSVILVALTLALVLSIDRFAKTRQVVT